MNLYKLTNIIIPISLIFTTLISSPIIIPTQAKNSNIFREYIGAEFKNVTFSDVPIHPNVQFDFILSFGIDYTTSTSPPSPTNGEFNIFWDSHTLSPHQVSLIKQKHKNVRVALSLGGDSVNNNPAYFDPKSIHSWVSNAYASLKLIISQYHLDGIDIDYEHFKADSYTFAECIGQLITRLKREKLIQIASIAPFDNEDVQKHYIELWKRYGHVIDYVNFQFYAYDNTTTIPQFIEYFEQQVGNYKGGKILSSFISDGSKGLPPSTSFFPACRILKKRRQLFGIFVWCADDSKSLGFSYEKRSQVLLSTR